MKHLASGGYKEVNVCEWLAKTVAVAVLDVCKEQALAEATLLATVQHPNVVELLGLAFKDDERNPQDLGSLIDKQMESRNKTTIKSSPFPLPIAIDIVLQVVEAMIHVKA